MTNRQIGHFARISLVPMEKTVPEEDRLDSWKQIAAYLNKSERTVRRWQETENLPVHKHPHRQRGSVWAYRSELDVWLAERVVRPDGIQPVAGETFSPGETKIGRPYGWLIPIAAVLTLGLILVWRTSQPHRTPVWTPLTTLPGEEYGASFSPDGKRIVFYWSAPESLRPGLYLKSIDDDRVSPLTVSSSSAPVFNYSPAWSPDGNTIAFLRRSPNDGTRLILMNTDGSSERKLVRVSDGSVIFFANHRHVSWSPDQNWIFVPIAVGGQPRGVYRVSPVTGEVFPVVSSIDAYAPAVSPDGRSLIVLRIAGMPLGFQEVLLYKLNADGSVHGDPVSVYKGYSVSSGIAWMPDNRTLVFCNSENQLFGPFDTQLYKLSATRGAQLTAVGATGCNTVSVSAQGTVACGNTSHVRSRMLQMRFGSGEGAREFAASSRYDAYPAFSPTGDFIAFYSNRSGRPGIWIARRDGSDLRRIVDDPLLRSGPAWSPDAQRFAYVIGRSLAVRSVTGLKAPLIIDTAGAVPQFPLWSSDGGSLYYSSGEQLWRVRIDGTGRRALGASGPILSLAASVDGKTLYYASVRRRFTLCRRSLDDGSEHIVEEALAVVSIAVTAKYLYFIRSDMNLYALPLAGGAAEKRGPIPQLHGSGIGQWETRFTVSPDDSTIIWTLTDSPEIDIELLRFR